MSPKNSGPTLPRSNAQVIAQVIAVCVQAEGIPASRHGPQTIESVYFAGVRIVCPLNGSGIEEISSDLDPIRQIRRRLQRIKVGRWYPAGQFRSAVGRPQHRNDRQRSPSQNSGHAPPVEPIRSRMRDSKLHFHLSELTSLSCRLPLGKARLSRRFVRQVVRPSHRLRPEISLLHQMSGRVSHPDSGAPDRCSWFRSTSRGSRR